MDFLYEHIRGKWHYSLNIDNFTQEKILVIYRLSIAVVSAMSPKPNYRPNQDYTKQFDWTCDLSRDVYNCYIKARENKSIGHMKRLNSYWGELHPGFSFLGDKNFRDVSSRIAANRVVIDTEFRNTLSIATETDIVNNEVVA